MLYQIAFLCLKTLSVKKQHFLFKMNSCVDGFYMLGICICILYLRHVCNVLLF